MRYIDWNIKCSCNIDRIMDFLDTMVQEQDCVIALQEVMPEKAQKIREHYGSNYSIIYSLDYREAGEFDTDNRRLGVMLLVSKDYSVIESNVFARCLFPERTLWATLSRDGVLTKVATFHSITGVSFKMGKAVQFRSFAEAIRDYKPDLMSLDANEPRKDHYLLSEMEFWDQGDKGWSARLFFEEIERIGLVDAYSSGFNEVDYSEGEPLAVSHIVNKRIKRRYDLVFVRKENTISSAHYYYDEAIKASSDHAMVVCEICE